MKFSRKLLIQIGHGHFSEFTNLSDLFLNAKDKLMAWPENAGANAPGLPNKYVLILWMNVASWEMRPSLW